MNICRNSQFTTNIWHLCNDLCLSDWILHEPWASHANVKNKEEKKTLKSKRRRRSKIRRRRERIMPWSHPQLGTSYEIKMSCAYSVQCPLIISNREKSENCERISSSDKGICYWPFGCLQPQYKKQYLNCPQSTDVRIAHIITWYINIWPLYCASNFVFRMKFKNWKICK